MSLYFGISLELMVKEFIFWGGGGDTYQFTSTWNILFVVSYRRSKGKSKYHGQSDHRVTHASIRPSLAPSWEELITVEIKTKDVKKEGRIDWVVLSINIYLLLFLF